MEIAGYENYLIYLDGKVQNKKTKRYRKPSTDKGGYNYVILFKNGTRKSYLVHRLIASYYIPNDENKPQVDHINRDRTDNRIENLRWVTRSENQQNTGIRKNNTSGHKNICYREKHGYWVFEKTYRGKQYQKYFKTLSEALCYKYIFILKIKAGIG